MYIYIYIYPQFLFKTMQSQRTPPGTTKLIVTPEDTLQFGRIVGSGAFGTVYEVMNSNS